MGIKLMPNEILILLTFLTLVSIASLSEALRLFFRISVMQDKIEKLSYRIKEKSIEERCNMMKGHIESTKQQLDTAQITFDKLSNALEPLHEQAKYIESGLGLPIFSIEHPESLKNEVMAIRQKQFSLVKAGKATTSYSNWDWFGNKSLGNQMVKSYCKILLRAFNNEFEMIRKTMRHNTYDTALDKLYRLSEQLTRLGETVNAEISNDYLNTKFDELLAYHNYLEELEEAKQERKKQQAELREQNKQFGKDNSEEVDEELALRQSLLKKARKKAELLYGTHAASIELEIEELQKEIAYLSKEWERATSQAQITRSGFIYVISNIGSFGADIVKIGMTRRLEPMDRVKELGDASVPFSFDVHTLAYVNDAPKIERLLHQKFDDKRVNKENLRKEFFRVSVKDVQDAVIEMGIKANWFFSSEAKEYRESELIRKALLSKSERTKSMPELTDFPASI